MEQVDGHHTGGDGHVKAGAENTEHAQRRQKAGVDTDEATDPAAERRTDAKQGRDLAALEASAQGERCDDQLDDCVRQGGVAGKSGAGKPRGKAGVVLSLCLSEIFPYAIMRYFRAYFFMILVYHTTT